MTDPVKRCSECRGTNLQMSGIGYHKDGYCKPVIVCLDCKKSVDVIYGRSD